MTMASVLDKTSKSKRKKSKYLLNE